MWAHNPFTKLCVLASSDPPVIAQSSKGQGRFHDYDLGFIHIDVTSPIELAVHAVHNINSGHNARNSRFKKNSHNFDRLMC